MKKLGVETWICMWSLFFWPLCDAPGSSFRNQIQKWIIIQLQQVPYDSIWIYPQEHARQPCSRAVARDQLKMSEPVGRYNYSCSTQVDTYGHMDYKSGCGASSNFPGSCVGTASLYRENTDRSDHSMYGFGIL